MEAVEALLAAGADLNAVDEHGMTALHSAAYLDDVEVAKVLLKAGAATDIKNRKVKKRDGWDLFCIILNTALQVF